MANVKCLFKIYPNFNWQRISTKKIGVINEVNTDPKDMAILNTGEKFNALVT